MQPGEAHPGMVVHGHEQILPAGTIDRVARVTCDAVARAHDAPELLDVNVQHVAWRRVLVALHRFLRIEVTELGQSRPTQDPTDGRSRHAQACGNAALQQAATAQFDNGQRFGRIDRTGRASRPGGLVFQAIHALRQEAPQPLACCERRHAMSDGCCGHAQTTLGDVLNHLDSTGEGESGILMAVHSSWAPESTGGLAISSLSDSVRVNTRYNLLKLHS